jgi:hypothetical protein
VQAPLPRHIDAEAVIAALDPRKDVDGQHPLNLGRLAQGLPALVPNTAAGGMELLRRESMRSSLGAPISSASRWPCCCYTNTPPLRSRIHARQIWERSCVTPTSSPSRSDGRR